MFISFTKPQATMSIPKSGSIIVDNAPRTSFSAVVFALEDLDTAAERPSQSYIQKPSMTECFDNWKSDIESIVAFGRRKPREVFQIPFFSMFTQQDAT
jgi:hypothetical protein